FKLFSVLPSGASVASAVRRDALNRFWLCTSDGIKLLSNVQKRNQPIAYDPLPPPFRNPAIVNQPVTDFFEDIDGNHWISTNNGLIRINSDGPLQVFTTRNGLPTNLVNNFFQDREKKIWMCSQV